MVSRHRPVFVLALFLLAGLCMPAGDVTAAWPVDGRVLCDAAGNQARVLLAADGADGAIAVWLDDRHGYHLPYMQRIGHTGVPLWQANGICAGTTGTTQDDPRIASDGAGGAYVVWEYYATGTFTGFVLMAQHVSGSGAVLWAPGGISVTPGVAAQQLQPAIAPDGTGGAFVVWADFRGGVDADIYVQHLLPTGLDPAWPAQGVAVCTAAYAQGNPLVVPDGYGGALLAWEDFRTNSHWNVYAHRVLASGQVDWTWLLNGHSLCSAINNQIEIAMISDDWGGAIVAWTDQRSGTADVFAQRFSYSGGVLWAINGVAVCGASGIQDSPAIASDGAHGALIAWRDYRAGTSDIYAQHVTAAGASNPAWPSNGLALCSTSGVDQDPALCSDGAGGAIVAWTNDYDGLRDIHAHHALASGELHPGWPSNGRAVCAASLGQQDPAVVADGYGGALIAWEDARSNSTWDIYAGRVSGSGWLGTPEPVIASVRDVPGDQGGRVSVRWTASDLDAAPGNPITAYDVWREVPAGLAAKALRLGATACAAGEIARDRLALWRTGSGFDTYYWEYVGSQPARGFAGYSYTAPTPCDSVAGWNPMTLFMVVACDDNTGYYYDSTPDSGYSVDDLAPAPPGPFAGQYGAGIAHLHWNASPEPDLQGYRLHRGATAGFTPGPENLVIATADTGYVDASGQPFYYKLVAVDIHGNVSAEATLLPQGALAVGPDGSPGEAWLGSPSPNPSTRSITLAFALPRPGPAALEVFDVTGRKVWQSGKASWPAGVHAITWPGRDAHGGRAAPGVYQMQLVTHEGSLVRRAVLAR